MFQTLSNHLCPQVRQEVATALVTWRPTANQKVRVQRRAGLWLCVIIHHSCYRPWRKIKFLLILNLSAAGHLVWVETEAAFITDTSGPCFPFYTQTYLVYDHMSEREASHFHLHRLQGENILYSLCVFTKNNKSLKYLYDAFVLFIRENNMDIQSTVALRGQVKKTHAGCNTCASLFCVPMETHTEVF